MGLGQSKDQKNIIDVVEQIAYKLISKTKLERYAKNGKQSRM